MSFTISINDEAAFEVLFAGPAGPTGPQGPQGVPGQGVPVGGTAGQVLAKVDGVNYNTEWITPQDEYAVWGGITGTLSAQLDLQAALDGKYSTTNPSGFITSSALVGYATESYVTSQGYITSSALTPYLTISSAASTYQPLSGMTSYLTKAGNLSGLTDLAVARDNLQLGVLYSPTFAGLSIQGSGANVAQLTSTALTINQAGTGQFSIQPSTGITFPDSTTQITAFNTTLLAPYALINSQVFTGTPSLPTGTIGVTQPTLTSSTQLATTAFVQQELAAGTAVAKNLEVLVRNQTGSSIPAGSVVYISGATGNLPLVTLAQGNNDANSAQTMGFVKTTIANNGQGYVIVRGLLENVNTSAFTEGVQLYLSPTTPGAWTTTKPVAPQHMVYIGIVIRSHPTLGTVLVAVQNGLELEELHDVLITAPTNGQVLKYNSTSGLWVNGTDVGGATWGSITGTLSSQTDLQNALNAKANLAGATFTGKVNFTSVSGASGLNIGIGGTSAASTTNGDLWISTGGTNLNFRDGTGSWRILVNTSNTNTFSASQIIDTTSATAALRVTQKGTGNAIEVEDSTTPDATRFTVDQFGKVGIGVAPDTTAALNVDANGIKAYGTGGLEVLVNSSNGVNVSDLGGNVTNLSAGYVTLYAAVPGQGGIYFPDGSLQSTAAVSGISDAPSDGVVYGRQNASWVSTDSLYYSSGNPSGYIPDAPSDGNYYVRQNSNWVACTVVSIYDSNTSTSYNCLTV